MDIKFYRFYFSSILLIGMCAFAEANIPVHAPTLRSTYIHINGLSYHFDASPSANEFLYGVGFHYDWFYTQDIQFKFLNGILIALEAEIFNDSQHHWAYAAGLSFTRTLQKTEKLSFDLGITTGLTYKKNLRRDSDLPVYPFALPFFQIGTQKIKIRTTWIPPVRHDSDNQLIIQLVLRWKDGRKKYQ